MKKYFESQIYNFLCHVPPILLLYDSAGRISRELWLKNQEFSTVDIIPPWFSMLLYHLEMNTKHVGDSSSET
jgi:hypothetical protein